MFAAECRECRRTVLITRILAVVAAPGGNVVVYRCACGTVDAELIERTPEPA